MAGLIYLASPYSHQSAAVREARYLAARSYSIHAIQQGYAMFSPIVYGRDMETQIGTDYLSWKEFNDAMVRASASVWVLRLYGWENSKGVEYEVNFARELKLPIAYVDPRELP